MEVDYRKPQVQYMKALTPIRVGQGVLLAGLKGHPRLRDRGVNDPHGAFTGDVIAVHAAGVFETHNTIYKPMDEHALA